LYRLSYADWVGEGGGHNPSGKDGAAKALTFTREGMG